MAKTPEQPKMKRRQQFVETFKMARKGDPRLVWWLLGAFVLGAAIGFGLFWILPGSGVIGLISSIVGAIMLGLLAALLVFSRRAQASAYAQIEGRPGGAASGTLLAKPRPLRRPEPVRRRGARRGMGPSPHGLRPG